MEPIISTPRLELRLFTSIDEGSSEFECLHDLLSNEQSSLWSIRGRSTSFEFTKELLQGNLSTEGGKHPYTVFYTVYAKSEPSTHPNETEAQHGGCIDEPARFLGRVIVLSLGANALELPEDLMFPAAEADTTLALELAYMFLPDAWGKGYATEAVKAVLEACRTWQSFWTPYTKLYVRAIVNDENPASQRVMQKSGLAKKGVFVLKDRRVYIGGRWQTDHVLHIFGGYLLE